MNWKTIVVGIDETEASHRALERAADLAQAPGVELVVTSAAAVLTGMAAAHGVGPWDPADSPDEHREELAHAREYLRAATSPRSSCSARASRRRRSWTWPRSGTPT